MAIDDVKENDTKEAAIRGLHAYKERLLAEIKRKEIDLRSVERSIDLLSGEGHEATTQDRKLFEFSEQPASRYSNLGKQAATELFLRDNAGRWFKASVVAKELLRRGMKPTKHWGPTITGTLNRCATKGLAKKEKRNGVYMYRSTTENAEKQ
jgi:hypothetical protein